MSYVSDILSRYKERVVDTHTNAELCEVFDILSYKYLRKLVELLRLDGYDGEADDIEEFLSDEIIEEKMEFLAREMDKHPVHDSEGFFEDFDEEFDEVD